MRAPRFLALVVSLAVVPGAPAEEQPHQAWVARYAGENTAYDFAVAVATDAPGNVYVTGTSSSGTIEKDYVTLKYDTFGNRKWIARYDGPDNGSDLAKALVADGAGNVYVTGLSSRGTSSAPEYATVKYDTNGNLMWVARTTAGASAQAPALAVDGKGNVYMTGGFGRPGTGADYGTVKYDASGNQLWIAYYNRSGTSTDNPVAVAVDGGGNVYVTGTTEDPTSNYQYATVKYDASGAQLWAATYNGGGAAHARALAVDGSGNVFVTGRSIFSAAPTYFDLATVKYGPTGNQLWAARYNDAGDSGEWATGLALDSGGNVYVAGTTLYGTTSGLTQSDYVTVKYSPLGNQVWAARYNAPAPEGAVSRDTAVAIALGGGYVHVTGTGLPAYSPSIHVYETPADYVTVRYDAHSGAQVWSARHIGRVWDDAVAMAVDKAANIYVTGISAASDQYPYDPDYSTVKYAASDAPPTNVFEWADWAQTFHLCVDVPASATRVPDLPLYFPRCSRLPQCIRCSRTFSAEGRDASLPDALLGIYGASLPMLDRPRGGEPSDDSLSGLGRLLQAQPEGAFYDRALKASALRALAEAKQAGRITAAVEGTLVQVANALELDWRVPTLRPQPVRAGRSARVDFGGVAAVTFRGVQSAGEARLEVQPGLPAVPAGYKAGWPLASYQLGFTGRLTRAGSVEIDLYVGGLDLPGGAPALRLLEWDGKAYRELPSRVDARRGTIRATTRSATSTFVVAAPARRALGAGRE